MKHDMDTRFANIDRMVNFLVKNADAGHKCEASKRLAELEAQLRSLRDKDRADENLRNELRLKLTQAEDYNMEMANFIRGLQNQSEAELSQMRDFLKNKVMEDQSDKRHVHDKQAILFQELVRIG
jgi:hypothetical protein